MSLGCFSRRVCWAGSPLFPPSALDAALMWQRGQSGAAALYIIGSVVLSIVALFLGR